MSALTEPGISARMAPTGLSRRDFLLGTLASALVLGACKGPKAWMSKADDPDWLTIACGDREAAAALGRAYLATHPKEAERAALDAAITQALAPNEAGTQSLFQRLDRAVRAEYVRDDTLFVDHWLLSRTEARLYALAALPTN
jgi:hypothetical protein